MGGGARLQHHILKVALELPASKFSMVKGPGKRPRARPAALVPLQAWAAVWEFPAPEEDIRGSPLRVKPLVQRPGLDL